jgi:hypothetical protein
MSKDGRTVEALLERLPWDSSVVVELYPALLDIGYWLLVHPDFPNLQTAYFLTYEAADGVKEIPAFTDGSTPLMARMNAETGWAVLYVDGRPLFERMLEIVETGKVELAINPGNPFGVRLNREILLSLKAIAADPTILNAVRRPRPE